MTGEQVQILAMFVGCAVAIPIVVVGWMRDPMGRGVDRQRKADESEARMNCAPQRPHVEAAPAVVPFIGGGFRIGDAPVDERVVDVISVMALLIGGLLFEGDLFDSGTAGRQPVIGIGVLAAVVIGVVLFVVLPAGVAAPLSFAAGFALGWSLA
jgi:hypothetical protein